MGKTYCQVIVSVLTMESIQKFDSKVSGLNCDFKYIQKLFNDLGLDVEVVDVEAEYECLGDI